MKRRALGKGLSSLIPGPAQSQNSGEAEERSRPAPEIADASSAGFPSGITMNGIGTTAGVDTVAPPTESGTGSTVLEIDVERISPNPHQPRQKFSEAQLDELAGSIKGAGVLQPILVRRSGKGYQLIAGERRWRAAQRLGLHKVPAIVRDIPDDRLLEVALIENIQREELNPIEEARAYLALQRERGMTQESVADAVGKDRATVANTVRLLKLPRTVQERVESGVISMGHARALLPLVDPKTQESIAQVIVNKGLNVRQTESLVRRSTRPQVKNAGGSERDPNVSAAEEQLCRRLGTKVRIVQKKSGAGHVLIEFYSEEELDRIYEILAKSRGR